ncbi:MAG: hypothetical protein GX575_31940 [Candidatus Anammoximicrobium sp.]|nr:hypothetical protein [Candidatus Anammoximicrobium sp.]
MDSTIGPFDYRAELERRVQQFAHYLKLMHGRAHDEVQGNCYIIFEERPPDGATDERKLSEERRVALQLAFAEWTHENASAAPESGIPFDLPDDGWREDPSRNRFVQFAIERNWFCMDLPRNTLFRPEAEEILARRRGFFYLRDRKQFTLYHEDVEGYDPFRKIYIYGDEDSAAEDMAFIFFEVWKFPVESRLYVTAAAFGGKKRWERGFPIE